MSLPRAPLFAKIVQPTPPRDPTPPGTSLLRPYSLLSTPHRAKHLSASKPSTSALTSVKMMENLDTTTGGGSGGSFHENIIRDPASARASTPEDYNENMFQKQLRPFFDMLEIQAFVRFIEPGTLVAIYNYAGPVVGLSDVRLPNVGLSDVGLSDCRMSGCRMLDCFKKWVSVALWEILDQAGHKSPTQGPRPPRLRQRKYIQSYTQAWHLVP